MEILFSGCSLDAVETADGQVEWGQVNLRGGTAGAVPARVNNKAEVR